MGARRIQRPRPPNHRHIGINGRGIDLAIHRLGTWMAIRTVLGNPDGYGRGEGDGGACSEWEHGQATGRSRTPDTADPDTFGGVPKRMRN